MPRFTALICLLAAKAFASGFYFGENGTKALLQGGAFTGQADDLTAIQHNPAGLSQLRGFNFLVDLQLENHEVSFLRKDVGQDTSTANVATNTGGLFLLPFAGLGYGLKVADRPLGIALGVYGPPSVGRYQYPKPNYARQEADRTKYVEDPRKFAPNRYALINNDVIILYPSLSAAYEVHPKFTVGVSAQYVFSHFYFSQAVYSGLSAPPRMSQEDPNFDSIVSVDLNGKGGFTGILGVLARPTDEVAIGLSFRPSVPISARGAFILELGETARQLGTDVQCPNRESKDAAVVCKEGADLSLELPIEARVGVSFTPLSALTVNADWVYQGWQSMDEIVLEPQNVSIKIGSGDAQQVAPFHIPKRWHHSQSVRLGGSWAFDFGLTAHAGVWYETEAAPDEQTSIDFLHFSRLFATLGVSYRAGPLDIIAGGAYTPAVTKDVKQSDVKAGNTDPTVPGQVIGIGTYTSGGWIGTLGLRGRFGAE